MEVFRKETRYPLVSVIIPVYNDNERLKLCLAAIGEQTYPADAYEIIVIDNNSEEDVEAAIAEFKKTFQPIQVTHEPQPGSYIARNTGLAIAQGEVIAFTDSDCIPQPAWLEKGVESLLSVSNCGLVAGRIDLFFKRPNAPTPVEIFESVELNFNQDKKLENDHYGMTANVFTFKRVLDDVGYFDEQLKSGGDRDWGQQVYAAGYQQIYADEACVLHPARHSFADLQKRIARLTGGRFDRMMQQSPSAKAIALDIADTLKPPFRSLYRAWNNEKVKGIDRKLALIWVMFFARYVVTSEKLRLYMGGSSNRG